MTENVFPVSNTGTHLRNTAPERPPKDSLRSRLLDTNFLSKGLRTVGGRVTVPLSIPTEPRSSIRFGVVRGVAVGTGAVLTTEKDFEGGFGILVSRVKLSESSDVLPATGMGKSASSLSWSRLLFAMVVESEELLLRRGWERESPGSCVRKRSSIKSPGAHLPRTASAFCQWQQHYTIWGMCGLGVGEADNFGTLRLKRYGVDHRLPPLHHHCIDRQWQRSA